VLPRKAKQSSHDVCNSSCSLTQLPRDESKLSHDVTALLCGQLSRDVAAIILHCFPWSIAIITWCHCLMYHSYLTMRVIYHVMWPTSCTMWSSPILKVRHLSLQEHQY